MQIQVIKMLEYPAIELEERIREEMVENPALEIDTDDHEDKNDIGEMESSADDINRMDDMEWAWNGDNEDYSDSIPEYRLRANNHSVNDKEYHREQSFDQDLSEYLLEQLSTVKQTDSQRKICEYIIGNVDTNGYIRRNIEQMVDDMAVTTGTVVSDEEMEHALKTVQTFEPAGVGARDLQECLVIQIDAALQNTDGDMSDYEIARRIVADYFDQLVKKQYAPLMRRLNVDRETFDDAISVIRHLNPNPGANFGSSADTISQTIIPDFIVENVNNRLVVSLNNSNVPVLRVNPEYSQMLQEYIANAKNRNREMKDALIFAKQKIDSAKWFIDSLNQRNNTLLQTMRAIVDLQREYFLSGDDRNLRPMKLKDVADRIDFDISTISRVSNSKYVETEWGVVPLKHFFSESMTTHDGEEVSNKEIKTIIRETIENEDKNKPIADDALTEVLNRKGYKIARRTVAKYREQLNIPVARMRRAF